MKAHECNWPGCTVIVSPGHWGCGPHLFQLPERIKWALLRGRHSDPEYRAAARDALAWAEEFERR